MAQGTSALTGGGGIIGTPAYMSPEQWRGQPVDWRSDLYSLGVIVFQMLSGRLPYHADTPVGLIYAHVHDPIPDVVDSNPDLPPACADLIERAMAKDPAERYQTARELAADLGVALSALVRTQHAVFLQTEPLPPVPPYAPTVDVVKPAAMPHTEIMPTPSVPKSARRGVPAWAWIGGAVAVVGVIVGGLALSGVFGGEAEKTSDPTPSLDLATADCRAAGLPEAACTGITRNADWTPYIEEINSVAMVLVPAGCFMMGSENGENDKRPAHEVCFDKPFWIDIYEITQAQFAELGGEAEQASCFTGDNLPRECITWTEAKAFCQKRGVRLPTEAEWEYAARGPDGLVYPWGNEFIADNVVYDGNSGGHTWDVGSKPGGVSWIGAYDLSGNVWEWVADWYGIYSSGRQVNPTGPENGHWVAERGGGMGGLDMSSLRAACRFRSYPVTRLDDLGFRCGGDASDLP